MKGEGVGFAVGGEVDGDDMVMLDGEATTGLLVRYISHQSVLGVWNINRSQRDVASWRDLGSVSGSPRSPTFAGRRRVGLFTVGCGGEESRFQKVRGRHPALMR